MLIADYFLSRGLSRGQSAINNQQSTLTALLLPGSRWRPERVRQHELCDLSAESHADFVGVPEVDPGVDTGINDFLNALIERLPLSRDAGHGHR
jgi:hypothetical protein